MSSDPLLLAKIATPHKDLTPITITISYIFNTRKKVLFLGDLTPRKAQFAPKNL